LVDLPRRVEELSSLGVGEGVPQRLRFAESHLGFDRASGKERRRHSYPIELRSLHVQPNHHRDILYRFPVPLPLLGGRRVFPFQFFQSRTSYRLKDELGRSVVSLDDQLSELGLELGNVRDKALIHRVSRLGPFDLIPQLTNTGFELPIEGQANRRPTRLAPSKD
jgi:hypothetical protein